MLSGYRVFSRRFVKTFPAQSAGFEIETELTVHAFSSRIPMKEVETDYFARPIGSVSKLSTFKDGFRILMMIVTLIKEERPLYFFSVILPYFFTVFVSWYSRVAGILEYRVGTSFPHGHPVNGYDDLRRG